MKNPSISFTALSFSAALLSTQAMSQTQEPQHGNSDLTPAEICDRLSVRAETFRLSADGHRLLQAYAEGRIMEMPTRRDTLAHTPAAVNSGNEDGYLCEMRSGWSSNWGNGVTLYLQNSFGVDAQGRVHALIKRFAERVGAQGEPAEPVDELSTVFEDFAPLQMARELEDGSRLVVHLSPFLREPAQDLNLGSLPLVAQDAVIYSDNGELFARHVDFSGAFVGVKTRGGTYLMSHQPFPGAEESGRIRGRALILPQEDGTSVTVLSQEDFLPGGVAARLYVRSLPQVRSSGLNSVGAKTSSDLESWERNLEEWLRED